MRILFWNTHQNRSINTILGELIIENNASIVVLAEYRADINELINILAQFLEYVKKGAKDMNIKEYVKSLFYRKRLLENKAKLIELKHKLWLLKKGEQV